MRLIGTAGLASLLLAALPAPSAAGKIDCLSREGQCIAVKVGGQAALTRRDVLEENRLPAGRYLLAVTLSGRSNWDRHVLYFEVKD